MGIGESLLILGIILLCLFLFIEASNSILNPNSDIINKTKSSNSDLGVIGKWVFILGSILAIAWVLLAPRSWFPFTGRIILFALAGYGLKMFRESFQKSLPKAKEILAEDDRKPILFLRSFERDNFGNFKFKKSFLDRLSLDPMSHIFDIKDIEQIIVDTVRPFGPVVAIGKPGEELPPIGAYRHYTAIDEDWQETILNFMKESSLIVIILDFSEGVLWELRKIVSNNRLKDTIIFYPAISSKFDYTLLGESWRNSFERYQLEFPFLISPKIGTVGLMFSNRGEPIELWTFGPDLKELLRRVQEIIYERLQERPIT